MVIYDFVCLVVRTVEIWMSLVCGILFWEKISVWLVVVYKVNCYQSMIKRFNILLGKIKILLRHSSTFNLFMVQSTIYYRGTEASNIGRRFNRLMEPYFLSRFFGEIVNQIFKHIYRLRTTVLSFITILILYKLQRSA